MVRRSGLAALSLIVLGLPALAAAPAGLAQSAQADPRAGQPSRFDQNPFLNLPEDDERTIRLPADANPFDPIWLNNHAIELASQGWLGVAEQLLERALKIAPQDQTIQSNLQRLRHWHQIRSSEFRPATGYEGDEATGRVDGPPPAPMPWDNR